MFSFEHSWALLLIPVVAFLLWKFRFSGAIQFSSLRAGSSLGRWKALLYDLPNICVAISLLIAIVALANPLGSVEETLKVKLSYRIVAVIDKSGSMDLVRKGDVKKKTRMDNAKKATIEFFNHRPDDIVAVVPFAETALIAEGTPFTTDREYVYGTINSIATMGSTAIGNGIIGGMWLILRDIYVMKGMKKSGLSMPQFEKMIDILLHGDLAKQERLAAYLAGQFGALEGSFIVVITDGESNEGVKPEVAIKFAAGLRIPVYVIGVGEDIQVEPPFAGTLTDGGGAYFHSKLPERLKFMYQRIDELRPTLTKSQVVLEQYSYRKELAFIICILLVIGIAMRARYIVLERT